MGAPMSPPIRVAVIPDGPLKVSAGSATLCRRGLSRNKPWCDGRHRGKKGFR